MKRNLDHRRAGAAGFTLVELLVVMAIIAILASIAIPNVARFITRGRMTKAMSEVKNADTSFTGMLSDAQVANFRQFFDPTHPLWATQVASYAPYQRFLAAQEIYTNAFYDLCRNGKNVAYNQYGLRQDVVRKLGTSYMELGRDPWNQLYNVYAGPWSPPLVAGEMLNASVWNPPNEATFNNVAFKYTPFRIRSVTDNVPGGPIPAFDATGAFCGPKDMPIYIWSSGEDQQSAQSVYGYYPIAGVTDDGYLFEVDQDYKGGGDDINNWDSSQSWVEMYG
jgi:prepilin-type N-terminal cleavage/methylation domain-containing protein